MSWSFENKDNEIFLLLNGSRAIEISGEELGAIENVKPKSFFTGKRGRPFRTKEKLTEENESSDEDTTIPCGKRKKNQMLTPEQIRSFPCCMLMCAMTLSIVDISACRDYFQSLSPLQRSEWIMNWMQSHSSFSNWLSRHSALTIDKLIKGFEKCYTPAPIGISTDKVFNVSGALDLENISGHSKPHVFKIIQENEKAVIYWKKWSTDQEWQKCEGHLLKNKDLHFRTIRPSTEEIDKDRHYCIH